MSLYLSFPKCLFHNYVCQVVKGNDPIIPSGVKKKEKEKEKQVKIKQMFYELLEVGFVRITGNMVSDSDSISATELRKGRACLWASLWPFFPICLKFTDAELINRSHVNR